MDQLVHALLAVTALAGIAIPLARNYAVNLQRLDDGAARVILHSGEGEHGGSGARQASVEGNVA
jgi:hypothetical protein